jgi:hypothetical protein
MGRLDEQTVLRLPQGTAERAEKLIPCISNDPSTLALGKITRYTVLRMAIVEGMAVLENKYKKKEG